MIEVQNPFANNGEILENEVEDNVDSTNSNNCIDLWSLHRSLEKKQKNKTKSGSHASDEIHSYLDKSVIGLKEDPIIEWENIKGAFPNLYQLARQYLFISATSVPSERLFSKTGNIMTKSRNRI